MAVGISLQEKHLKVVVVFWAAGAILFQTFNCITYCPHCGGQLFGFIIRSHKEGAELLRFMLGLNDIKCYKCHKIVYLKEEK